MKKIFAIPFLFFLLSTHVQAQGNFEIGYRFGNMKCANLNRSVYVYNYTRQWLSDKMDYFTDGKGYFLSYGQLYDHIGWEMGVGNIHQKNVAHGLEPTTGHVAYRRISFASTNLYLGIPVRIMNKKNLEINFVPSFDGKWNVISTDYTHDETFKSVEESDNAASSFKLGTTMAVAVRLFPVQWFGIDVKPFASFNFKQTDVAGVQDILQGARYNFEMPDPFTVYGISFLVVFAHRDDY